MKINAYMSHFKDLKNTHIPFSPDCVFNGLYVYLTYKHLHHYIKAFLYIEN